MIGLLNCMIKHNTKLVTKENGLCFARKENKCCWCGSPLGEEHDFACPCRKRTVVVKVVLEVVMTVPECYTKENLRNHWLHSRTCGSNIVSAISKPNENDLCMCNNLKDVELLREATEEDEADWYGE